MLKFLKYIFIFIICLFLYGVSYYYLSPQLGERMSEKDKAEYSKSANFNGEYFVNNPATFQVTEYDIRNEENSLWKMLKGVENSRPSKELPVLTTPIKQLMSKKNDYLMSWLGHSTILMKVEGKVVLFDPMFSNKPTPHPLVGSSRYSDKLAFEIKDLPYVDVVMISHDHYDHLDYESIKELISKTKKFFVPLGVARHLRLWGVPEDQIVELDWWESGKVGDLELYLTPSQHFSGRSLTRADTLWGSWYIKAPRGNIYFSGDTGYGGHFKEIKERLGKVDLAFLESGQYNKAWAAIHMMPEETAKAAVDLEAKKMMPIHWGAFSLSIHSWYEPVERVAKEAERLKVPVFTPVMGELINIEKVNIDKEYWWLNFK